MKAYMYHYTREISKDMPCAHYVNLNNFKRHIFEGNPINKQEINGFWAKKGTDSVINHCKLLRHKSIFTFDDGIRDNLAAASLLNEHGCTGIFFICTRPYLDGKFLDVHLIHYAVYQGNIQKVYEVFERLIDGNVEMRKQYTLFKESHDNTFNFYIDDEKRSRIKVFMNRYCPLKYRYNFMIELLNELGLKPNLDKFYLNVEDMYKLKEMGMVIGCHGHTHNLLSRLTSKRQENEISKSTIFLNKRLNQRTNLFSYPYGRRQSYTHHTIKLLKKYGYSYAFSVNDSDLEQSRSFFELSRYNCNSLNTCIDDTKSNKII